ncbi:MAG: AAA family ATPase [Methanomicrobiales archaeon]|jgi:CO dehydrogenase maturation factor|nr:AAA family ATPase [Methanomicrobiales archaeon]
MKPPVVAVAGKGGTGKTTITALLIRTFVAMGVRPLLAVDADPNANLHEALGVVLRDTLGSLREIEISRQIPPGVSRIDYIRLRFRQALVEEAGYDLIAMGRPEGRGCYCYANDLLTTSLQNLTQDYRLIQVDNEAGMEHIARGTVALPDLLLIVTDPGVRGVRTAARIQETASEIGILRTRCALVVNCCGPAHPPLSSYGLRPLAFLPYDPAVEKADLDGRPIVSIPINSPISVAVAGLASEILSLIGDGAKV